MFLGGIVSLEDLDQYEPYDHEPISVHLENGGYTVYSAPPPSSGVVHHYALNILDGMTHKHGLFVSKERFQLRVG